MFQRKENIRFYMGELVSVVPETNTIETDKGCLSYDYAPPGYIANGTDLFKSL